MFDEAMLKSQSIACIRTKKSLSGLSGKESLTRLADADAGVTFIFMFLLSSKSFIFFDDAFVGR